jgi:hypothetical protein
VREAFMAASFTRIEETLTGHSPRFTKPNPVDGREVGICCPKPGQMPTNGIWRLIFRVPLNLNEFAHAVLLIHDATP